MEHTDNPVTGGGLGGWVAVSDAVIRVSGSILICRRVPCGLLYACNCIIT